MGAVSKPEIIRKEEHPWNSSCRKHRHEWSSTVTRQRLQKLIAAAGVCSRRRAEDLLRQHRVKVNGQVATIGDQADLDKDDVEVDGRPLQRAPQPRILLLNKPPGVICSCHDPQQRRTVLDLVPASLRDGLHPVGRLDAESRGALLLSNHGELTLKLTHPRYNHRKTYRVMVAGLPAAKHLKQWRSGVVLDGTVIEKGAEVRTAIVDVDVAVRRGARVGSAPAATAARDADIAVIGAGATVRDVVKPGEQIDPGDVVS